MSELPADGDVDSVMQQYVGMSANELRAACRKQKVTPATLTKPAYMAALRVAHMTERVINASGAVYGPKGKPHADKKTVDCVFRLINVLFSDEYAEQLSRCGDLATRHQLDTKSINSSSPFWKDVTQSYNDEDDATYDVVTHVVDCFSMVDPASFRRHDGKKLWDMWNNLLRDYRKILVNFTKSGNNGSFDTFHHGNLAAYYLHLMTTVTRPNLHAVVVQLLPFGATYDTLNNTETPPSATKTTPDKPG